MRFVLDHFRKAMDNQTAHAHIQYPAVKLTPAARAHARLLINGFYSERYGKSIRMETPITMRSKILEIEAHISLVRRTCPIAYNALARQCTDYERICALLEVLR